MLLRHTLACISAEGDTAAWLRQGELEAQTVACAPYAAAQFKQALQRVRALTVHPVDQVLPDVQRLCAAAGVAVVVVPALSKSRAGGATLWLSPTKAMLLLSLRYRTDDHFWFSFFHEAGHILLHGKRDVFLDAGDTVLEQENGAAPAAAAAKKAAKEKAADAFAAELLIPQAALRGFVQAQRPHISKESIRTFAVQQGIAPGIIVGRLQHEQHLPYTHCNELKEMVTLSSDR